jgi:hypothetical protein
MNAFNFELCFPYLGLTGTEYARKLIIPVCSWSQSKESKKCDMRINTECIQASQVLGTWKHVNELTSFIKVRISLSIRLLGSAIVLRVG